MKTTKQEYSQFLHDNFIGLRLGKPLFYNWDIGLRFDLQVGDTDTDKYFDEVNRRACSVFQTAFDNSDKVFLVFIEYKYKRRKIRLLNFAFKQVDNLKKSEISYSKVQRLYSDNNNIAIIKLTANRIKHKNILTAIGNSDFWPRQPRLDDYGALTSKEIYFINIDKKLILHMYDDRGLDLIAADRETLRPIYKKYGDWLLDYDRVQMDKQFE